MAEEARDDEREALARVLFEDLVNYTWPITKGGYASAREVAEVVLAAGYRKHPEPEITEAMVKRAEYVVCGGDDPWIELEEGVMLRALEAALRVPFGEGTQQ